MTEPRSCDSHEEQMANMNPVESDISAGAPSKKYRKTSEESAAVVSTPRLNHVTGPQINKEGYAQTVNTAGQVDGGMGNMTFNPGANMNVTNISSTLPPACDNLLQRTISKLDNWTKGIVETAALKKVMDKINKGVSWVTIKGCPGEGKTTTARMALNELHKAGRKIFDVNTPKEFSTVVTSCREHPVIMLDDVFGNLEFDKTEWSKWKTIILKTLADHQHYSENIGESSCKNSSDKELTDNASTKKETYAPEHDVAVILVGRQYVLNVCVSDLGKVADFFTHEKHVINMSDPEQGDFEEKVEIWKAISESSQLKLDDDTIQNICTISIPHGFPHVCKLFVTLRKKNPDLSAELFFEKPLEFLNETIEKLIQNKEKRDLFKAMLENEGKITAREIEDHKDEDMNDVATHLVGTYLRKEDDCFMFDHPSVYDSVAYTMCTRATSFVIQNCKMNFIHERIRLNRKNDPQKTSHLVVTISRVYIPELATRFAMEISERKFSQSLCHQAFTDAEFVAKTMPLVSVDLNDLVVMEDTQTILKHSFWTLLSSNGSPELLKYVEKHRNISREEYDQVLFGVCLFAATDVLCYIEENKFYNVNVSMIVKHDEIPAMMAAKGRNKSFVDKIMSLNPNVHTRCSSGKTLLHLLAQNGLTEAVESAIKKGACVNCVDTAGSTPLNKACVGGHEDIVNILIDNRARVNINKGGSTPLQNACRCNHVNIVQSLIRAGASPDDGTFVAACQTGNVTLVKLLVPKGFKIDISADAHTRGMLEAVRGGKVQMVKWLVEQGVSVLDEIQYLHDACELDFTEIAKVLLESGADVNSKDHKGNSPLHVVSSDECFDVLFEFKPNILEKNRNGDTALHTSALKGLQKAVSILIEKGLDVNAFNSKNETPLLCASLIGAIECVQLLIDSGADVNVTTKHGNTPLHGAVGSKECLLLLVKAGAKVNVMNNINRSPLSYAVERSFEDKTIVDFLIKNDADVNESDKNDDTPLHYAVKTLCHPIISLLLETGANPRFTNVQGQTPLHLLIAQTCDIDTCVSIIRELINHGADVNSQDAMGNTPIHFLKESESNNAIKTLLIKSGADVYIKNNRQFWGFGTSQHFMTDPDPARYLMPAQL